jgi:methyl-accepting chemotaxis protein
MDTTRSQTETGATTAPKGRVITAGAPTRLPLVGRRRNYFINPGFQLRLMLLPTVIAVGSVSLLVFLHFLLLQPGPERTALSDGPITLGSLINSGWLLTSVGFSLLFASLFIFLGVIETHRAAGAIFKLKCYLHRVATGDLRNKISLRRKDHFQDVADEFNVMLESLQGEAREELGLIHQALDGIGHVRPTGTDETSKRLAEAWDHLVNLKHRKERCIS